ncbi:MAG TPA: T9SS type A sorting domain-containing protein [Bacteroidetes bacterium]|nr:T9SS type A sorting domain-containing protein [Bacteroidota bacterium]
MIQQLKFTFLLFSLLAVSTFAAAQEYTAYLPDDANIQYAGRIDFSNPLKPAFAFPGISIKAKFNGTGVKVNLKGYAGTNYFNVFIDGVFLKKFALGNETINEICQTNLNDGTHTVEITKRTESFLGKAEFLGFDIAGTLLPPDPMPVAKIEFIGNSITCGYGNEDVSTGGFVADLENNYLAYGAVCARELNAQYRAVAYSGRGVAFNFNCSEGDLMPEIYEKYFADEDSGGSNQYDHSSYVPDLIVINLGTNDHNCDNINDDNFKAAYVAFISQLRAYHPNAKILCLTGPMNSSEIYKTRVEDIVETSGGEQNGVYFFHQTPIINNDYRGGHGHPNTLMADINGKEVAAFILANNLLDITSGTGENTPDMGATIFPNPIINGALHIDLTKVREKEMVELNIINMQGKTVCAENLIPGNVHEINMGDKHGMYILVLKNRAGVHIEKIIVL